MHRFYLSLTVVLAASLATLLPRARAESRVESNIVYGMYSGLALLMDIYYPEKPNGYGVVFISGSGWGSQLSYGAHPLKESGQQNIYAPPLLEAGYTVFAINHRATPRFHYPAPVDDAQRAVRFIRHNAGRFGIDPDHISAVGGSSGGHLVAMLGTLNGAGDPNNDDPVERQRSKVQCVVARATPSNFLKMNNPAEVALLLRMRKPRSNEPSSTEHRVWREASPVFHVSSDDPPFLLIHGDADATVPYEQSVGMQQALKEAGVEVRLFTIPGGGHGPTFGGVENAPDYLSEMVQWLNKHLPRR